MIVRPELISANKAPNAKPLNNCDTKLGHVIMRTLSCEGVHPSPFGVFEVNPMEQRLSISVIPQIPPVGAMRTLTRRQRQLEWTNRCPGAFKSGLGGACCR